MFPTGFRFLDDYCNYYATGVVVFVGGNYAKNQSYGAFCPSGYVAASYQGSSIGCRLMKLP